ncbi:MAG: DnaJ domain-containing protein [Bryobacteraceae bacterium]
MSAPLAGKFQDHYEVLGIEPKADIETIQSAYGALSEKYHPSNPATGDQEAFDAVNLAYEILSDPSLRKEFDKLKGAGTEEALPQFAGLDFFVSLGRETSLRMALLCILYDRRRANPLRPGLSMRHLEMMMAATSDELVFALWYLKQRRFAMSDDKSSLQITVDGMDFLETSRPSPEVVMPMLKPASIASSKLSPHAILHVASSPVAAPAAVPELLPAEILRLVQQERPAPSEPSSALKALREALAGAAGRIGSH